MKGLGLLFIFFFRRNVFPSNGASSLTKLGNEKSNKSFLQSTKKDNSLGCDGASRIRRKHFLVSAIPIRRCKKKKKGKSKRDIKKKKKTPPHVSGNPSKLFLFFPKLGAQQISWPAWFISRCTISIHREGMLDNKYTA